MSTTDSPGPSRPQTSSGAIPVMPVPCRRCRMPIAPVDAFCKHCGARQQETDPFYYHPVWILLLAFLVLGPFALGLVWRARTMTPLVKAVLAVVITAYSAVTIYYAWVLCATLYEHFRVLGQVL